MLHSSTCACGDPNHSFSLREKVARKRRMRGVALALSVRITFFASAVPLTRPSATLSRREREYSKRRPRSLRGRKIRAVRFEMRRDLFDLMIFKGHRHKRCVATLPRASTREEVRESSDFPRAFCRADS